MDTIYGVISLKTYLEIEDLGKLISVEVFAGIPFIGINESIYDEIPAIYLEHQFLGLRVELGGHNGFNEGEWYTILMYTSHSLTIGKTINKLDITSSLVSLFKEKLKDYPEILVIEPKS